MASEAHPSDETMEIVSASLLRKVAAMLDNDAVFQDGVVMPRGWHFALLPSVTPRAQLRADGFSGLGVAIPDLGLPRLMLASRTVEYRRDLIIGEAVLRSSAIDSIEHKGTPERPRAVVKLRHELRGKFSDGADITETQTFLLMPQAGPYQAPEHAEQTFAGEKLRQVVPDATLLFMFSALGFNAHKIHLDREFAQKIEGFPDLVVNGGLTALWITELARVDLGITPASLSVKYLAPLFCGRLATIATTSRPDAGPPSWQINVHDNNGTLAAAATVVAA